MKKLLVLFMFFCPMLHSLGQKVEDIDLELFIESLFAIQDEDLNYEDIYETLFQLYTKPLNLNSVSRDGLLSLYLLSIEQVNSFLDYRHNYGKLLSIYELQAVPGFDLQTIRRILPFVTVRESGKDGRPLFQRIKEEPNNYLILRTTRRLEQARGYMEGNYLGDPFQHYIRYRNSHVDDYSIGFTMEKDAGEAFRFDNKTRGFDFYSAHFQIKNQGLVENLIVGDFQAQFGQGLVFGAGFNPGKGAETVNTVKRGSTGLRPYTSVIESGFFRGGGITLSNQKWQSTIIYSRSHQDGRLQSDTTYSDFDEFVSAIQVTGFHRTANELVAKNNITEQSIGTHIAYQINRKMKFGVNALHTQFSIPLQRRPNNYNQFEFSGKHQFIGSVNGDWTLNNMLFFAEAARSRSGGMGLVTGMVASLSPSLDASMVYRNYEPNFHTFYGNAFSETSRIINEKGIYWGLKWQPDRRHMLNAYYDVFTFPWLQFRVEAPSQGNEYLFRYSYLPTRKITFYAQFRAEQKQRTFLEQGEVFPFLYRTQKRNYLFNFDMAVSNRLSIKTRVQASVFSYLGTQTHGFALSQDITYRYDKWRFSGRYALFDTDDFENRQYMYEKDALYAFSIPAYHGQGSRTYLLVQHQLNAKTKIWVRAARFRFHQVNFIGSGNERINGNTRTDIRVQAIVNI